jgi:hypothetical protein
MFAKGTLKNNVLSVTAPFISDEQELQEKESLTESELQAIHNDLYGMHVRHSHENEIIDNQIVIMETSDNHVTNTTCCTSVTSTEMVGDDETDESVTRSSICSSKSYSQQNSLVYELIREALEQMPSESNEAYRHALEKNPTLIQTDCNWDYFISVHQSNVWTAAEAIASYWTIRRTVFGSTQYYLSMTLQGVMENIRHEFDKQIMYISGLDDHGRPIMFVDRIRMPLVHRDIVIQIFFFWLHQLMLLKQAPSKYIEQHVLDDETKSTTSLDQYSTYSYVLIINMKVR